MATRTQSQIVPVPQGMGLREENASWIRPLGALDQATNVSVNYTGSYEVRAGFMSAPSPCWQGGHWYSRHRVLAIGQELIGSDGPTVARYNAALGKWFAGMYGSEYYPERVIPGPSSASGGDYPRTCDVVIVGTYMFAAWTDSAGTTLFVRAYDAITGAGYPVTWQWTIVAGRFRIYSCGGQFVIVMQSGAATVIYARVTAATMLYDWPDHVMYNVITATLTSASWDGCTDGVKYLWWVGNHAITKLYRIDLTTDSVTQSSGNMGTGSSGPWGVCWDAANNQVVCGLVAPSGGIPQLVLYSHTATLFMPQLWYVVLDATVGTALYMCLRTVDGIERTGGTRWVWGVDHIPGTNLRPKTMVCDVTSLGVTGNCGRTRHVLPISRQWTYGGRYYVTVSLGSTQSYYVWWSNARWQGRQSSSWIVETLTYALDDGVIVETVNQARVVCRIKPYRTGLIEWDGGHICSAVSAGTGGGADRWLAVPRIGDAKAYGGYLNAVGFDLVKIVYLSSHATLECQSQNTLLVTGGCPQEYDGYRLHESGFHWDPIISTAVKSGVGTFLQNVQYTFYAQYRWLDARGDTHISAPSPPHIWNTADNNIGISVSVHTLSLTNKYMAGDKTSPVYIDLYCTQANGTVAYWMRASGNLNTPDTETVSMLVTAPPDGTTAQLDLASMPCGQAPPMSHAISHLGRVWCIDAENPTQLWFSDQRQLGEAIRWIPGFTLVTTAKNPYVALASVAERLVCFRSTGVDVVMGSGPASTGEGNDLTDPRELPVDIGARDPRGVVGFPNGVMFQSTDGQLWVLDSGFNASWIGASVRDEIAAYSTVLSSVMSPSDRSVRLLCSSGSTTIVLVYYYAAQAWSVWKPPDVLGTRTWTSATMWYSSATTPVMAMCQTTGIISAETPATYIEANLSLPTMTIETAWISLAGVQVAHEDWELAILAEYLSAHAITIDLSFDYGQTTSQYVFSAAMITALLVGTREQILLPLVPGDHEAIKIKLTIVPDAAGAGQSARIQSINLRHGGGEMRLYRPGVVV